MRQLKLTNLGDSTSDCHLTQPQETLKLYFFPTQSEMPICQETETLVWNYAGNGGQKSCAQNEFTK